MQKGEEWGREEEKGPNVSGMGGGASGREIGTWQQRGLSFRSQETGKKMGAGGVE